MPAPCAAEWSRNYHKTFMAGTYLKTTARGQWDREPPSYSKSTFATPLPRTLRASFRDTKLSSKLEVRESVTTFPPAFRLSVFISSISHTSTKLSAKTRLPVLHRPVIGVTVSLDGRDSIDSYWDSVTIGLSSRRPSRSPYVKNERD